MRVHYDRPDIDKGGLFAYYYDIISREEDHIRVYSRQDLEKLQAGVIKLTESAAAFLERYGLPKRHTGEASIKFRVFPAIENSTFFPKDLGDIYMPDFYIHTSMGNSYATMWPKNSDIKISINGDLAEKAIKKAMSSVHKEFRGFNIIDHDISHDQNAVSREVLIHPR